MPVHPVQVGRPKCKGAEGADVLVVFVTITFPLLFGVLLVNDLVELENKPLQCPFDIGDKRKRRS